MSHSRSLQVYFSKKTVFSPGQVLSCMSVHQDGEREAQWFMSTLHSFPSLLPTLDPPGDCLKAKVSLGFCGGPGGWGGAPASMLLPHSYSRLERLPLSVRHHSSISFLSTRKIHKPLILQRSPPSCVLTALFLSLHGGKLIVPSAGTQHKHILSLLS